MVGQNIKKKLGRKNKAKNSSRIKKNKYFSAKVPVKSTWLIDAFGN